MKKLFYLLTLVLFLPFFSLSSDEFIIGVEDTPYFPHYLYVNGEFVGYARAVFDAFSRYSGHTFIYKSYPVIELYNNFAAGKVDFKYPDHEYWGSQYKDGVDIHYSGAVVEYLDGVLVVPWRRGRGVDEIKVLGTYKGFTVWDYMDRIKSGRMRVKENPDFFDLLKSTIDGKVDAVYCNISVTRYVLKQNLNKPNSLVFDPSLPHTRSDYKLSSIKHAKLIKEFDRFLTEKESLIHRLKKQYEVLL